MVEIKGKELRMDEEILKFATNEEVTTLKRIVKDISDRMRHMMPLSEKKISYII